MRISWKVLVANINIDTDSVVDRQEKINLVLSFKKPELVEHSARLTTVLLEEKRIQNSRTEHVRPTSAAFGGFFFFGYFWPALISDWLTRNVTNGIYLPCFLQ